MYQYRLLLDPALTLFSVANVAEYIKRYKHHKEYINKVSTLTDMSKPEQFTDKKKLIDWYLTLINFLGAIPGRNGVPLSYLCRPTNVQVKAVYKNFIDEYVDKAPLVGQSFATDAAEVHTYMFMFASVNTVAEVNMVSHAADHNGCLDFVELEYHYEGVGVHVGNAVQTDKVLNDLFCSGENKPHMWWDEFETHLTDSFNTYDFLEKRRVHSNYIRLRILNRKILANFLQATKAPINLELAKTPVTITYENSLGVFPNKFNQKFPPELSPSNNRTTRRINEVAIAEVVEAVYFRAEAKDIKDAVEVTYLADMAEVDLDVDM